MMAFIQGVDANFNILDSFLAEGQRRACWGVWTSENLYIYIYAIQSLCKVKGAFGIEV